DQTSRDGPCGISCHQHIIGGIEFQAFRDPESESGCSRVVQRIEAAVVVEQFDFRLVTPGKIGARRTACETQLRRAHYSDGICEFLIMSKESVVAADCD